MGIWHPKIQTNGGKAKAHVLRRCGVNDRLRGLKITGNRKQRQKTLNLLKQILMEMVTSFILKH